ncbi:Transcription factor TFIIIB component B'' [Porphyridium purpureum]|uniref:Transcription factor TFIIIB component B n=1 Tax=Porphyridium purpureum TaxID=35688 RepID=A0A5J4ZAX2_PORPP|nr:Transcription factor TFIIIB component B'' [Porphyridium purpureum]|eukprot:POR1406..scf295_1
MAPRRWRAAGDEARMTRGSARTGATVGEKHRSQSAHAALQEQALQHDRSVADAAAHAHANQDNAAVGDNDEQGAHLPGRRGSEFEAVAPGGVDGLRGADAGPGHDTPVSVMAPERADELPGARPNAKHTRKRKAPLSSNDADTTPESIHSRSLKEMLHGSRKSFGGKPMPSMEAARAARKKQRRDRANDADMAEVPSASAPATARASEPVNDVTESTVLAPQVRFDETTGQVIIDEASLILTPGVTGLLGGLDASNVEPIQFASQRAANASFPRGEKRLHWTLADTELFYEGIRKFGTDFSLVESMMPHRSRRQIKQKFNKEEKLNPERVHAALGHG